MTGKGRVIPLKRGISKNGIEEIPDQARNDEALVGMTGKGRVIPLKRGISKNGIEEIPAFAGMTNEGDSGSSPEWRVIGRNDG
jgi:hypothetical protein